jgi:hypothetical protein
MIDQNNQKRFSNTSTDVEVESGVAHEDVKITTFNVDQSCRGGQHAMAFRMILGITFFLLFPSYLYFVFLGLPVYAAIVCVTVEAVMTASLTWPVLLLLRYRILSISLSSRGISCRQQTYSCGYDECSRTTARIKSYVSTLKMYIASAPERAQRCKQHTSIICIPTRMIMIFPLHFVDNPL